MFGSGQIGLAPLAQWCRRMATALDAGINVRKVLAREADSAYGRLGRELRKIHEAIGDGDTLEEALNDTGEFFPLLVRRLVAVGERTGQLPEVLQQLAEHYEEQLGLRREFLSRLTWPLMQLTAAIFIVGFLIYVLGVIGSMTGGPPQDVLGIGLVGTTGTIIYFVSVFGIIAGLFIAYRLLTQSLAGTRAWHSLLLALPVAGPAFRTLALSRLAWTLALTEETSLDLREAIPLALGATDNACFAAQAPQVVAAVEAGSPLSEALSRAGRYPVEFLETLMVGEESGQIAESMARLARQYRDEATRAMATLSTVAGFVVWAIIAGIMVVAIFRIFHTMYLGPLNEALKGI